MLRKPKISINVKPDWATLANLLNDRASRHPNRPAISFLSEEGDEQSLTYAELETRVGEVAAHLMTPTLNRNDGSQPGDRVLLLFPPGIEFLVGFLACQYARLIPVPTCFPKPGRAMPRLDAAAADCEPTILLADSETLAGIDPNRVSPRVAALRQVATDWEPTVDALSGASDCPNATTWNESWREIQPEDLGLLQYTSGSTSNPKGVMVSHANLLSNLESIRRAFCIEWSEDDSDDYSRGVFWLPPFHDMGLIGGILEAIYVGGHTVLMSPRTFLARPMRWLQTISDTKASISGAPNFAYQLCVDRIDQDQARTLDLSHWELAFCGAEPISADTLDRFVDRFSVSGFSASSFCPCYGLAEATLLAASGMGTPSPNVLRVDRDDLLLGKATIVQDRNSNTPSRRLVSCGEPGDDMTLKIVDPESHHVMPEGEIGEVWLQGDSVTGGYWKRDDLNAEQFRARIRNTNDNQETTDPNGDTNIGNTFLRTGDLGFVKNGELYVTGRCKDVVILRGRNHYPQDIETTVQDTLGSDFVKCVAVASEGKNGDTLSIVVEASRHMDESEMPDVVRRIRRAVIEDHEVDARRVMLTRPGAIPLTTSGKVQRQACRGMLASGEITARYDWSRSQISDENVSSQMPPLPTRVETATFDLSVEQIETWLLAWLVARGGVEHDQVHPDTPFADYGLDSLAAVELSGELEDWLSVELTPVVAWNYPTPARLAVFLAEQLVVSNDEPASDLSTDDGGLGVDATDLSEQDFERLLAEIEQLPDEA